MGKAYPKVSGRLYKKRCIKVIERMHAPCTMSILVLLFVVWASSVMAQKPPAPSSELSRMIRGRSARRHRRRHPRAQGRTSIRHQRTGATRRRCRAAPTPSRSRSRFPTADGQRHQSERQRSTRRQRQVEGRHRAEAVGNTLKLAVQSTPPCRAWSIKQVQERAQQPQLSSWLRSPRGFRAISRQSASA